VHRPPRSRADHVIVVVHQHQLLVLCISCSSDVLHGGNCRHCGRPSGPRSRYKNFVSEQARASAMRTQTRTHGAQRGGDVFFFAWDIFFGCNSVCANWLAAMDRCDRRAIAMHGPWHESRACASCSTKVRLSPAGACTARLRPELCILVSSSTVAWLLAPAVLSHFVVWPRVRVVASTLWS
jgi:hypothetical protein